MRNALAGLILAAFTFIVPASAQQGLPEPDGYRTEDYRAPVPATLAGARVLSTAEAEAIWQAKSGVFIDVMPRAPKPANLPQAQCGATSRGITFPAACGCRTRATESSQW